MAELQQTARQAEASDLFDEAVRRLIEHGRDWRAWRRRPDRDWTRISRPKRETGRNA